MPRVTFLPNDITVDVPQNTDLLTATIKAGIDLSAPCGGQGTCGRCLARLVSGDVDFTNTGALTQDMLDDGYLLTCRAKVKQSPITLEIRPKTIPEQGSFTNISQDALCIHPECFPTSDQRQPMVTTLTMSFAEPFAGEGLSDLDGLQRAFMQKIGFAPRLPLSQLQSLPLTLRAEEGRLFAVIDPFQKYVVDLQPESSAKPNIGLAVDIGTTTVAVQIVDLQSGDVLCAQTQYNGQIACGLDIISRINYAKRANGLAELRQKVLTTINELVEGCCSQQGISPLNLYCASLAGNTTMIHLLLGIVPEYIRLNPYVPAAYSFPILCAQEIGLSICPHAPVHIAQSVGSYVGGDITSGLLCTSLSLPKPDICLFIDIGTNGEMVLGNDDFLLTCACSAGPAFEGGGIDHGMRASKGAIEWVRVDPDRGLATYGTIGNTPPAGICGSGMISLVAGLFEAGLLDAAGKLDTTRDCPAIVKVGRVAKYVLCSADQSANGKEITISETDIENLIRAKAAIFSACQVLLDKVSLQFDDLTKIFIAGGFGRYLDIAKAIAIGLLPALPKEKYAFIGNASLMGAYMALIAQSHRQKQADLAQKMTYLDLSNEPGYMDAYTAAMFLPHTDIGLFQKKK